MDEDAIIIQQIAEIKGDSNLPDEPSDLSEEESIEKLEVKEFDRKSIESKDKQEQTDFYEISDLIGADSYNHTSIKRLFNEKDEFISKSNAKLNQILTSPENAFPYISVNNEGTQSTIPLILESEESFSPCKSARVFSLSPNRISNDNANLQLDFM